MSKKHELRQQREKTVINITSKAQENALSRAIVMTCAKLNTTFPELRLVYEKNWKLADIVSRGNPPRKKRLLLLFKTRT